MHAWMDGQITNGCFRLAAAAAAQGKRILSLSLPETRSLHSLPPRGVDEHVKVDFIKIALGIIESSRMSDASDKAPEDTGTWKKGQSKFSR